MTFRKRLLFIIISFLLLCSIFCLYFLQGFAIPTDSYHEKNFKTLYDAKKNSWDGVYLGASPVTRYWAAPMAFKEYGITVGSLATTNQPFSLTKYLIQESKKYQDPDVFIIELRNIYKTPDKVQEERIRHVTDNMKPSLLRLKAINASLDFMHAGSNEVDGNVLSVYFPALETLKRKLNSTLTKDVTFSKDVPESASKGFLLTEYSTFDQITVPASEYNTKDKEPIDPTTEKILYDLLDYCDTIDNNVLFVSSPYSAQTNTYPKLNTAIDIVESRGYQVLNFNTDDMIKELDINWETDYYDPRHVNILGAEKYTEYLGQFIKRNYSMEDHRNDPNYSDWEDSWDYYTQFTYTRKMEMKH